jgi:hypothetical protein
MMDTTGPASIPIIINVYRIAKKAAKSKIGAMTIPVRILKKSPIV